MSTLGEVALAVLVLNLPFGFWRAGLRRFSLSWLLAIHAPVPVIVGLRILSGLGWQLSSVPVLVAAFFAGQFLGGRLRQWWERKCETRSDPNG
jgi:F0F1-type ATP synthase membrane subunit a